MGSHVALRRQAAEGREDRLADIGRVKKAVRQHEEHDHKGEKPTHLKLATGGAAEDSRGYAPGADVEGKRACGGRMDRKHGGRAGKPGAKVNVIVAPQGGAAAPPQRVPVPVPVAGGPPPGAAGMPPGAPPPMPQRPPMAGPAGMPPAAMPHKAGGRAKRADGGRATSTAPDTSGTDGWTDKDWENWNAFQGETRRQDALADADGKLKFKDWDQHAKGGRAKRASGGMIAGAGSGLGRLEKSRDAAKQEDAREGGK